MSKRILLRKGTIHIRAMTNGGIQFHEIPPLMIPQHMQL